MFARKPLLPQKRTMRNLWLAPAMSSMDNWVEDVETFAYFADRRGYNPFGLEPTSGSRQVTPLDIGAWIVHYCLAVVVRDRH
jgi:hypothetical protein